MNHRRSFVLPFALIAALIAFATRAASQKPAATSDTVPIDLRDNGAFVELTLIRPDGSPWNARSQLDSGGGAVILAESLTNDLALKPFGLASKEEGQTMRPVSAPEICIE